jgi:hypothetical protein
MVCPVKVNLLAQYRITTDAYSLAVSDFEQGMYTSGGAGLRELLKLTRHARRLSKNARDNFKKHLSEHGC